ncbi:hypothetical protein [Salisaeta longa]|uniref:hypothetical protein n=1 Tax=Salisaeta longa TaxID=503170 RepID=UPI0003B773E5|nr:hypothetical protein [Salisaeta longa]
MLSDDTLDALERDVTACDDARAALEDALDAAAAAEAPTDAHYTAIATALRNWQAAQQRYMDTVAASEASDAPTAGLLLKTKTGTDPANARRGLPGASVDGADQPFDMDLTGTRGQLLTTALTDYLPALSEQPPQK